MIQAPVYCRRFVGRQNILDLLAERYRAVAEGSGSIVLLSGEPGIGKTRLVTQFVDSVKAQKAFVGISRCLSFAQAPFGPVADVLIALFSSEPNVLKPGDPLRQTLSRLLPDLEDEPPPPIEDRESEKRRQLEALAAALRKFSQLAPVIVVIEDLHWADLATLEFLQFLSGSVAANRLLLIATFRGDDLAREHPLRSLLARLKRNPHVWEVSLDPLTPADMRALIDYALEGHRALSVETTEAIRARSEGNPLYAEELLKSAIERSAMGKPGLDLPLSVSESVLERLARFDDGDRELLITAAAIGPRFEPEFLAAMAERPLDDAIPALKRALDMQLVVEESDGVVRYAFRHELTRDAIYSQLIVAERRPLHARIAKRLEQLPDAATRTAELAYHWWEARDLAKAAHYNEAAGDAASAVYAFEDAARFYQRALAAEPDAVLQRGNLLDKLGGSLYEAGFASKARTTREAALSSYEQAGQSESAARMCIALSGLCFDENDAEAAMRYAQRALAFADSAGPAKEALRWKALINMASLEVLWSRGEAALEILDRAAAVPTSNEKRLAAAWHQWRGCAYSIADDSDATEREFEEAERLLKDSGLTIDTVVLLGNYAWGMTGLGRRASAYAAMERALELAAARRYSGYSYQFCVMVLGKIHLLFGNLHKAREQVGNAAGLNVQSLRNRALLGGLGLEVGLKLQDRELLERYAKEELLEETLRAKRIVTTEFARAYVAYLADRGDFETAKQILKRTLEICPDLPLQWDEMWMAIQVSRYGDPADFAHARRLLSTASPSRAMRAHLALFDAERALRTGDRQAARERAAESAALFGELGWRWHEAQALETADERARALAIYREIADVRDAGRLEVALTPVNRRGRPKTTLTAREKEIAALVAAGKSNRAIADELFISERTVESHVSTIMEKLGAASRVEVATRIGPTASAKT